MASEYVFIDEWDVDAPQEAVFNALVDARTYPEWWKPVYIEVEVVGDLTGRGVWTLTPRDGRSTSTSTGA